jgi:TonB-linked SusC/RagA family outer membrane protein
MFNHQFPELQIIGIRVLRNPELEKLNKGMNKKTLLGRCNQHYPLIKILLTMKLTIILICFTGLMSSMGSTYAQLTLNLKNVTVKEALNQIESQSDLAFMYEANDINVDRVVDIKVDNKPVGYVLDRLFPDRNINYAIVDKHVVLFPSKLDSDESAVQQPVKITGKVTNEKGEPIPGVSVVVKGTTTGTTTDVNGNFTLELPENAKTIEFSFIGMTSQEVTVGAQTVINVVLKEATVGLEEVVVTGYGTQKRASLIGSVNKVTSKSLESRSVTNVASALQGRVAGLSISSTSGQPGGEGIAMNIRGVNSWGTGNAPLVLIDGVPGDMQQLSPDVIDNITVLKDALSASIYGARAANGVILVTTKRGEMGKIQVTYNAMFSTQSPTKKYQSIQDPVEFMNLYNTAQRNTSGDPNYNVLYTSADIAAFQNGTYQGTNWNDFLYENNFVQEHRLGLSGGTEKVKFNSGLSWVDQPGIINNFGNNKFNFFGNFDLKVNNYISAGGSTNFTRGNFREPSPGILNLMILSVVAKPTYNPTYVDPVTGETKIMRARWTKESRNASLYDQLNFQGDHTIMSDNLNMQAFINITPLKGLVWQTKAATFYTHNYDKTFRIATNDAWNMVENTLGAAYDPASNSLNINQPWAQTNTLYSTLSYNHAFGKHNIGAMAGYEIDHNISQSMSAYRNNFPSKDLQELNAGATTAWTNSGTSSEWGLQSYFGKITYDYDGKYLVEGNVRNDQSSRFAPGSKSAVFPSVGLGWVLSKESFMNQITFISNLKLRAAWGRLGNQDIGNYPYQSTYSFGSNYYFNSLATGVTPSGMVNENLTWETTTTKNIGFDLSLKEGLFSLSFEYYDKLTDNILRSGQVMATTGLSAPIVNNGSMRNKGIELMLGHTNRVSDKFSYSVNFNLGTNKNTVESFGAQEISGNTITKEGEEYAAYYLLQMTGIYQENDPDIQKLKVDGVTQRAGQIKYEDMDGDGNITAADRQIVGNKYPKVNFGINLAAQYGNFDFSAFIYGVGGYSGYQQYFGFEPFAQGGAPNEFWRKAWTPENKSNDVPMIYNVDDAGGNWYNTHPSTFFLTDLAFQRLKNIQIGYTLPESVLKSTPIKSLRFYLSGDNVLSHFNNKDAMVDSETNQDNSYTNVRYPQLKTYSLGLSIKF